jgi:hypothetical protein
MWTRIVPVYQGVQNLFALFCPMALKSAENHRKVKTADMRETRMDIG